MKLKNKILHFLKTKWYLVLLTIFLLALLTDAGDTHRVTIIDHFPIYCPDDYPDTDEGSKALTDSTNQWTNEFFDKN